MDRFCCSFAEVISTNTRSSDYFFFSGRQINKDSALLPWGKSSVTSSTFFIHGWTQLICYTVFLINGLLRQATRANGSIWISHRQTVRLKLQPQCCPSSAPAVPRGFAQPPPFLTDSDGAGLQNKSQGTLLQCVLWCMRHCGEADDVISIVS